MKNFEVFENNAGGLALVVYGPHCTVDYIHTGYEYSPGQLSADLDALRRGADPAMEWDDNEIDDFNGDQVCDLTEGAWGQAIADNWGTYYHLMGAAGRREFLPDDPDDDDI